MGSWEGFIKIADYGTGNESRGISRDFNFESHVQFLTNDPCTLFFSAMHPSTRRGGMRFSRGELLKIKRFQVAFSYFIFFLLFSRCIHPLFLSKHFFPVLFFFSPCMPICSHGKYPLPNFNSCLNVDYLKRIDCPVRTFCFSRAFITILSPCDYPFYFQNFAFYPFS